MRQLLGSFLLVTGTVAAPTGPALACDEPIAYAVGEVDPRFDVSRVQFRRAIQDAARVWEKAAGRELFVYRPKAEFRIDLAYGAVQKATARMEGMKDSLGSLRERIEEGKKRLEAAHGKLKREFAPFRERVEEFNREQDAFEARVRRVNEEGGASGREAQTLRARQRQLQRRISKLKGRQAALNRMQARVDRLAGKVRAMVRRHNRRVREARELAQPDRKFRQGHYQRTGLGRERITVNQYRSPAQLRFVLAHELGHALGVGHVDDPAAVMHYLNEGGDAARLVLTDADRKALHKACGSRR